MGATATGHQSPSCQCAVGKRSGQLVIGVVGGMKKAEAIGAALIGRLITGLITDEASAQAILARRES